MKVVLHKNIPFIQSLMELILYFNFNSRAALLWFSAQLVTAEPSVESRGTAVFATTVSIAAVDYRLHRDNHVNM